jgi:hydrogenase maturation protein HypF
MASRHGITGHVENRTDGVSIVAQGDLKTIDRFCNDILQLAPPASNIKSIDIKSITIPGFDSFKITGSKVLEDQITEISPDIAVCPECLSDLENDPGRIDYPFVNCTNCGPRFTIIDSLPYDRPKTTMRVFRMCPECRSQYNDILDRRFHAQPIACNSCGPVYKYKDHLKSLDRIDEILQELSIQINSGRSVAIKGMGGYHLMCDALNNSAVSELRNKKHRDAKPFAVMFKDMSTVREYCFIEEHEENELTSWRRPIVILRQKKPLASAVSDGLNTIGAMLPYMPMHYMMFKVLKTPVVVLTSGNISDEPIIIADDEAEIKLLPVAGSILSYNRQILNRTDDSVVRLIDNKISVIRRSRGYVPRPVDLKFNVEGILALGAEQKNSFCLGRGNQAVMSQFIGDLKNQTTYNFLIESVERFTKLFKFKPGCLVCDLHPDYLSTRYAEDLEKELNIPLLRIQHHHAHIASCMAENGIDEDVIGISLDGTGYGTDGKIWGGEFLIASLREFSRFSHFDYIALPGGDKAIDEPWRTAYSFIYKYFGDSFDYNSMPLFRIVEKRKLSMVREALIKNINAPLSSGAGRLFDAVSAILGLCVEARFDSEAPMRLESAISDKTDDYYPFKAEGSIVFADTFEGIIKDMKKQSASVISAKFHNTIAQVILEVSKKIRKETSLNKVMLSGGVFQNKYLFEKSLYLLNRNRFRVFTNRQVPANDGGISLGQLVIASKIRK